MADLIPLPPRNNNRGRGGRQQGGRGRGNNWRGAGGGYHGGGRHHYHRGGGGGGGGGRQHGFRGRGRFGGRNNRSRGGGRGRGNNNVKGRGHDVTNDPVEVIGEPSSSNSITIAVEGCCHGELDSIYQRLQLHETKTGQKIDLLFCCGDFESIRNPSDFHSCSVPPKYRALGSFPKFYAGEKRAPILTIFIGGNHEASQPLRELFYGGWVAPNIYYLGSAGVVRYGGLRIGGISGIYKSHDYKMGHFEMPPLDQRTLKSIYHMRNIDAYRFKCLSGSKERLDVMLSHDWPLGIEQYGDTQALLRKKPYFREEVERNELGNPANREILDAIKPRYWFSAHLHVKFKATVQHRPEPEVPAEEEKSQMLIPSQVPRENEDTKMSSADNDDNKNNCDTTNTLKSSNDGQAGNDKVDTSDSAEVRKSDESAQYTETEFHGVESTQTCGGPDLTDQMTKFLALDKCLPRRNYLSIMHVESTVPKNEQILEYDPEWLALVRKTHHLICTEKRRVTVPQDLVQADEMDVNWVNERIEGLNQNKGLSGLAIPSNFSRTAPVYSHPMYNQGGAPVLPLMGNPQTDDLLNMLELEHKVTIPFEQQLLSSFDLHDNSIQQESKVEDDANEIDIDDIDDDGDGNNEDANEIDIDEISNDEEKHTNEEAQDANEIDIDEISKDEKEQTNEEAQDRHPNGDQGGSPAINEPTNDEKEEMGDCKMGNQQEDTKISNDAVPLGGVDEECSSPLPSKKPRCNT